MTSLSEIKIALSAAAAFRLFVYMQRTISLFRIAGQKNTQNSALSVFCPGVLF